MIKNCSIIIFAISLICISLVQISLIFYIKFSNKTYINGYVSQPCIIMSYNITSAAATTNYNHLYMKVKIIEEYSVFKYAGEPDFLRINKYIEQNPIGKQINCKYFTGYDLSNILIYDSLIYDKIIIDDSTDDKINIIYIVMISLNVGVLLIVMAQICTWRSIKKHYLSGLIKVEN